MDSKEKVNELKKLGMAKKAIAAQLGMTPTNLSVILGDDKRQFSTLQQQKIAAIYESMKQI